MFGSMHRFVKHVTILDCRHPASLHAQKVRLVHAVATVSEHINTSGVAVETEAGTCEHLHSQV